MPPKRAYVDWRQLVASPLPSTNTNAVLLPSGSFTSSHRALALAMRREAIVCFASTLLTIDFFQQYAFLLRTLSSMSAVRPTVGIGIAVPRRVQNFDFELLGIWSST